MKKWLLVVLVLPFMAASLVAAPRPTMLAPISAIEPSGVIVAQPRQDMVPILVSNEAAVAMMRDLLRRPDASLEAYRKDEETLRSILFSLRWATIRLADEDREVLGRHAEVALRHLADDPADDEVTFAQEGFSGRLPAAVYMEVLLTSQELGVAGIDENQVSRLIRKRYDAAIMRLVRRLRGTLSAEVRKKFANALVHVVCYSEPSANFSQPRLKSLGINRAEYERLVRSSSLPNSMKRYPVSMLDPIEEVFK